MELFNGIDFIENEELEKKIIDQLKLRSRAEYEKKNKRSNPESLRGELGLLF